MCSVLVLVVCCASAPAHSVCQLPHTETDRQRPIHTQTHGQIKANTYTDTYRQIKANSYTETQTNIDR